MWAVVVTEGCRKIKLQYYGFKLASATRLPSFAFSDHLLVIAILQLEKELKLSLLVP